MGAAFLLNHGRGNGVNYRTDVVFSHGQCMFFVAVR